MLFRKPSFTVVLILALPSLCLAAAAVEFTTSLGDFGLLVEQASRSGNPGKTWLGRIELQARHRANPTIKICEEYAEAIYKAIAQTGNIMGNNKPIDIKKNPKLPARDTDLFGSGDSKDLVVSAYTYKDSRYLWVSSLPRGLGMVQAKKRINGEFKEAIEAGRPRTKSATLLRSKLDKIKAPTDYVDSQIHAEEAAFALFETDNVVNLSDQSKYPAGSVVGSWHREKTDVLSEAEAGEPMPACNPDTNIKKENKACSIVTGELGVKARLEPVASGNSRGIKRPPPSDGEAGSSKNPKCRRGIENGADDMGPACPLPRPKSSTSRKGTQHTKSNLRARPTSSRKKGAAPTTLRTMHATAAGTRNQRTKPTSAPAARQRPTNTKQVRPTRTTRGAATKTGKMSKNGNTSKTGNTSKNGNTRTKNKTNKTNKSNKTQTSKANGGRV